jgi:hypothetical protein
VQKSAVFTNTAIKPNLSHHMAMYFNLRKFKCDKSGANLNHIKESLNTHKLVHSNNFVVKCRVCECQCKRKYTVSTLKNIIFSYVRIELTHSTQYFIIL